MRPNTTNIVLNDPLANDDFEMPGWLRKEHIRRQLQRDLLNWYETNRRQLPWRANSDPYRVWISEIMLQQTRVAAVIPYYGKFISRFPTVNKLAAARESSVLAAWSGLGYYRRARMLHAAAKKVARDHNGNFPATRAKLLALPGIGRYTSAAIASIAFSEPVAVVDGNVERVIQRLSGKNFENKEDIWHFSEQLLDRDRPGDFNQALMELGATVCVPKEPRCPICPLIERCACKGALVKNPPQTKQIKRKICYAIDRRDGAVFLTQRSADEKLMPGMWELPVTAAPPINVKPYLRLRHSITVTDFEVLVTLADCGTDATGRWFKENRLQTLPLTGLARKILRAADVI